MAFSPDEKYFYLDNWDEKKKVIMRYEVNPDGTLANGKVFFDMTSAPGEDALDGLKVDQKGNLYVSGPGGLWVILPKASIWERLVVPSIRIILPGETTMARPFIYVRGPVYTAYDECAGNTPAACSS